MTTFFRMPKTGSAYLHRKFRKTGDVKVIEHISVGQAQAEIMASEEVFCFVRNPHQRFYSAYNYIKNNGNGNEIDTKGGKILRQYLEEEFLNTLPLLIKKYPRALKHFIPQHKWIVKNNELIVDSVWKYENIDMDYKTIRNYYNFKDIKPRFNKAKKYNVNYPGLIRKIYERDIEFFGY